MAFLRLEIITHSEILKFCVLEVPPIYIPNHNGKMKILSSEFHHKTNLIPNMSTKVAVDIFGIQEQNYMIGILKFRFLRVPPLERFFVKERCLWPGNGFVLAESVVRFIPG
jgi:hypothetical protein